MRPSRKPDFVYEVWEFWIEEGVQYNNNCGRFYGVKAEGDYLYWLNNKDGSWHKYKYHDLISTVYIQWVADRILLEL
ncbi:hypothetical protein UFOVP53_198 [uncultured Caudovirales phage]|uniref:Uncharacterized protein n=1 Tax=uncultured Caudovirales phage TaxID=2100421 RepID=A0A6J5KT31_9CAUD|nr:hypothetical protein UFOVP53_198 [uncultured Caudovirales phage]